MASVRLKPELESRLRRAAEITGKTRSRIIQEAVEEHCASLLPAESLTTALRDYIGAFDSGGRFDASKPSDEFGEYLEEKRRSGHL